MVTKKEIDRRRDLGFALQNRANAVWADLVEAARAGSLGEEYAAFAHRAKKAQACAEKLIEHLLGMDYELSVITPTPEA